MLRPWVCVLPLFLAWGTRRACRYGGRVEPKGYGQSDKRATCSLDGTCTRRQCQAEGASTKGGPEEEGITEILAHRRSITESAEETILTANDEVSVTMNLLPR
jgi:hypothetical protein